MKKRILIIVGHPSHDRQSFCEALAMAYQDRAQAAGHETQLINISRLKFDPILHEGYAREQEAEPDIQATRKAISWAEHIVFVYPMWQFMPPALLKGFMERTFTQGFAYTLAAKNPLRSGLLTGKSARLMQTMGMPSLMYRLIFMQRGAKALKNMLKLCGISPIRISYFGMVESSQAKRSRYIAQARKAGATGT